MLVVQVFVLAVVLRGGAGRGVRGVVLPVAAEDDFVLFLLAAAAALLLFFIDDSFSFCSSCC